MVVLPDEPVNADDRRARAAGRAGRGRAAPSAATSGRRPRPRRAVRPAGRPARPPHRPRRGLGTKSWPSTRSPGSATNSAPGPTARESNDDRTGHRPRRGRRRRPPPTGHRDQVLERRARSRRHPRADAPRAAAIRSSNGWTTPADLLSVLVPLAEHRDDVTGPGRRTASAMAARRSATTCSSTGCAPGRPRRAPSATAARIAAGSSPRGLSSVTTSDVGALRRRPRPSPAAWPGRGRRRSRAP